MMQQSGLAASGSLLSGITSADQITHNTTGSATVISNGTAGFAEAADSSSTGSSTVYNIGYGMLQVAIGISVGLFLSSLVVYPFGKSCSSHHPGEVCINIFLQANDDLVFSLSEEPYTQIPLPVYRVRVVD